jgi:hypothetical protein
VLSAAVFSLQTVVEAAMEIAGLRAAQKRLQVRVLGWCVTYGCVYFLLAYGGSCLLLLYGCGIAWHLAQCAAQKGLQVRACAVSWFVHAS